VVAVDGPPRLRDNGRQLDQLERVARLPLVAALTHDDYANLLHFRTALRRFERFSRLAPVLRHLVMS
jgi:hypothetical protein